MDCSGQFLDDRSPFPTVVHIFTHKLFWSRRSSPWLVWGHFLKGNLAVNSQRRLVGFWGSMLS